MLILRGSWTFDIFPILLIYLTCVYGIRGEIFIVIAILVLALNDGNLVIDIINFTGRTWISLHRWEMTDLIERSGRLDSST